MTLIKLGMDGSWMESSLSALAPTGRNCASAGWKPRSYTCCSFFRLREWVVGKSSLIGRLSEAALECVFGQEECGRFSLPSCGGTKTSGKKEAKE